jgi:aminopeptidase N
MRLAVTDTQLDRIAGWLQGHDVPAGFTVDAEQRWLIVVALAAAGRIGEKEIAEEFARDTTSYGQIYSSQARGALPEAAEREAVWRDITGGKVSNTVQRNLCLGMARAQAESLVPYGVEYFEAAQAQWDNNTVEMARNMLEYAFPLSLAGRTDLGVDIVALGHEWLDTHEAAAPACRRLVAESVDRAERAVRAQAADRG